MFHVYCLLRTLSSGFMFSATEPRNWFLAGLRSRNRHRHRRPGLASEPHLTSNLEPWSPPEPATPGTAASNPQPRHRTSPGWDSVADVERRPWRNYRSSNSDDRGNEGGAMTSSLQSASAENNAHLPNQSSSSGREDFGGDNLPPHGFEDNVRAPIPVVREALYDDAMFHIPSRYGYASQGSSSVVAFRNFQEEMRHPQVWESEKDGAPKEDSRDNLAALYRPPFALMFKGPFEKAKLAAAAENKWLLANLQSTREFDSHMLFHLMLICYDVFVVILMKLNRDTWAHEAVAQTIKTIFIFWQVYDDTSEGSKVCTCYKLNSVPVVLLIDPITGQKIHSWNGMVHPDRLLEDLLPYADYGPNNYSHLSHKRPRETSKIPEKKIHGRAEHLLRKKEKKSIVILRHATVKFISLQHFELCDNERIICTMFRALEASLETVEHPDASSPEVDGAVNSTVDNKADVLSDKKPSYPPLPDEPSGDKSLLCRVGFRLPDGLRVQRNFLHKYPVQLLWSFCVLQIGEAETRPFRLMHPIPGASKFLEYETTSHWVCQGLIAYRPTMLCWVYVWVACNVGSNDRFSFQVIECDSVLSSGNMWLVQVSVKPQCLSFCRRPENSVTDLQQEASVLYWRMNYSEGSILIVPHPSVSLIPQKKLKTEPKCLQ
ncbi:Plant UBX domain-containing protein [Drosera capensis]